MKINIIICNNGLGHHKRIIDILSQFKKKNFRVFGSIKKLNKLTNIKNFSFKVFDIESEINNIENEILKKYKNEFLDMDFCWSDNLLFPYKYCKDTVITGSFLWCGHPNYVHSEEDLHLLRNNEVVLIGNKYFTRKNITQKLHFHPVGLFSKQKIKSNVHKKTNAILISSGQTDTGKNFLEKQIIKNLRDIEILSSSSIIYLESDIFSRISFKSKNIREALFDQKMFKEIGSAVIRPGMGTISE